MDSYLKPFCTGVPGPPVTQCNALCHVTLEPTQAQYSVILVLLRQETVNWGGWTLVSNGFCDETKRHKAMSA